MLEKPGNVKKPERTPTLNIENKAIPSQQLRQLLKTAGCSGAAVGGTAIALPRSTAVVSGGPLPAFPSVEQFGQYHRLALRWNARGGIKLRKPCARATSDANLQAYATRIRGLPSTYFELGPCRNVGSLCRTPLQS